MRTIRDGWSQLRAAEQREMDERAVRLQLLAYRDGFFTLIALLMVFFVLRAVVPSRFEGPGAALAAGALTVYPLAAMIVGFLVVHVSWRIRSGGMDRRVAAFKAGSVAAGFLVAYGLMAGLSLTGLVPSPKQSAISYTGGVAVAVGLLFLLSRRRDPADPPS